MGIKSWLTSIIVITAVCFPICQAQSSPRPTTVTNPSPNILRDYIYGYAPVIMQATRAISTAVPSNTISPGQAPVNQFVYASGLAGSTSRLIVEPNVDTLFTNAWLDLSKEPIILHVPDVSGRYYLIPMLDAYSNVFSSIGSRTTGTEEGNYALVGPTWHGPLPNHITGVIRAPTDTVWVLGRTLVNGSSDLQNALALTKQYQLIPLSAYQSFLKTGAYTPPSNVPVVPPNLDFEALPITAAPGLSMPEYFNVLSQYTANNPPPIDQFFKDSALVANGLIEKNQLNASAVSEATAAMLEKLASVSIMKNGWNFNLNIGSYGTDYLLRAAVAKYGLGANIPEDAIYMSANSDSTGTPLSGANSYVIHFAAGQTPPEQGFWSITPYNESGLLVSNSINRYDVSSESGLITNPDGSIDIYLQSTAPTSMQSN